MRPITFVAFLGHVAPRLRLSAPQRVACQVSFVGTEPRDLVHADREVATRLYGGVETIPPEARRVSCWVKGARIGGSMLSGYRLLHLALTVPLPNLALGEIASGPIVAPDMRLAKQPFRFALGAAQAAGIEIESESNESFTVVRDDGKRVAIECLPATRGGSALRGRTLVGAILSEAAFFRDENYQVNDVELFRAVRPRIVPNGGQILIESTPFAEAGLLYDLHQQNFGRPSAALVAECPTTYMRDDAETSAFVEAERKEDPVNAAREHDCRFMSAGAGFFFDAKLVDDRIDDLIVHPLAFDPNAGKASAADFGFVNDSSALTILQTRGTDAWLAMAEEIRPMPGAPLRPSEVSKRFAEIMEDYGSRELVTDGHYIESVREHVETHGISLLRAPEGQSGKLEAFLAARQLIADKRVRIPRLPRLIAQLKSVISRPAPGGGLTISIPRRKGMAHGDLASAFVLSCWAVKVGEMGERVRRHEEVRSKQNAFALAVIAGHSAADAAKLAGFTEYAEPDCVRLANAQRDFREHRRVADLRKHNKMLQRIQSDAAMTDEQFDAWAEGQHRQG